MKRILKEILLLVTILSLATTLVGCASGGKDGGEESQASTGTATAADQGQAASQSDESAGNEATPTYGGEIVVGIPQDLDSLDPHNAEAAGTREVLFNIFEGLVKADSEGNYVPAVASDYKVSDDAKTYTFTLREGVKFHDGSLVTAEDVKYSIDRCADDSDGVPLVQTYANIESVEITDSQTVTITLKEADTEFIAYMDTAIIPASNEDPANNVIGTGPFKFVSRSAQENVVLEKNTDYWGEQAYLDKVTFKIESNNDTVVTDLKAGSIDMYPRVSADQANQLDGGDFDLLEGTMNLVQALYLNNAEKPFDDVRVRQALCYAIDRQSILDMTSDGKGTIVGSSMFPNFGKYYEDLSGVYSQDIEKAKSLLTEAGYPDGFDMTITVPSNYTPHVNAAQVIVEQLKAIGVNAEIQLVEWNSWLTDVYGDRKYQSTVIGVDAASLTPSKMLARFGSDADNNFVNFNNEEYDETLAKAVAAVDDNEKVELYKRCQEILAEQAANVYIQDQINIVAINNKFGGYVYYPLYVQDMSKIYVKG